ncbi:MAG TPA: AsmA family protein [Cellvibrionaceae bacterium]
MKLALKILLVLVLLLVLAVVGLFFWLDPNIFKSRIEAMAREQGVHLRINGDLSWAFWPSVGIDINDVSVAALATPEDTIAELRSASLLVATRPLFNRELVVEHLLVDGATANLSLDQTGLGNWEALMPAKPMPSAPGDLTADQRQALEREVRAQAEADAKREAPVDQTAEADRQLSLAVDRISLTNTTLNYRDLAEGTTLVAELKELSLSDVNFEGKPISVRSTWNASLRNAEQYRESPLQVNGGITTQVSISADFTQFTLPKAVLALAVGTEEMAPLEAAFSADVRLLETGLAYSGKLKLEPFNLKQLMASLGLPAPETTLESALSRLSFSTDYVGTANSITLSSLQLVLDETTFNGVLELTDISRQALVVTLMGDAINVDHYLSPASDEAPAKVAASDEPLIPLELVQSLDAQVRLDLGSLVMTDLSFTNLRLRMNAKAGVIEMTEASADAYEGKLIARAKLDGRGDSAIMDFNAEIKGFQIAPVMRDLELDESVQLNGAIELTAVGKTRGVYLEPIMQALELDARFSGTDVTMAPINVEKYFCQAVTLMRDEQIEEGEPGSEQKQWPEYTVMEPVSGSVRMRNQVITLEGIEASVEALVLGIGGAIDLGEDRYDINLPLRLSEKTTSEEGCTVKSNYWLDRSLQLLRCRGSLSALSPASDCRLDTRILEDMAKAYAGERLQRELLRQLDKRAKDQEGEQDKESSSTEQAVEGLLNQFLRPKSQSTDEQKPEQ